MRDPIAEFIAFNRPLSQRHPELLRLKIARMAESPFAFYRGTFHLFARDVLDNVAGPLPLLRGEGAEMDLVGDIHSENYGTFKATDGAVHYDVNDFDETTRGRLDLDVCRLATSFFLAATEPGRDLGAAVRATLHGLRAYADAVHHLIKKAGGTDLDVSDRTPSRSAAVNSLITAQAARKRGEFIGKLTRVADGRRQIVRSLHYFNLADDEHAQALRLLADYVLRAPPVAARDYYEAEDVCGRVSGIGSMGRFRYVALIRGKGSAAARNRLLEFKEARPSAYDLYRKRDTEPAAWLGRAERVITVQRLSQAASTLHLGYALDGAMSFQVRELGPRDARLDFKLLKDPALLEGAIGVQAEVLARIHARAAARAVGPSNPLAELADADAFCQRVLAFALLYADLARRDWVRFVGRRAELEDPATWSDRGPAAGPDKGGTGP
jgi:uncharacterized protein (DUF2252 family)